MKLTFRKWVLNAMTSPNPTQTTKSAKYLVNKRNRDWSDIGVYMNFLVFGAYLSALPNPRLKRGKRHLALEGSSPDSKAGFSKK